MSSYIDPISKPQLQDRNTKLHCMETSWHVACLEFVGRCLGPDMEFPHFFRGPIYFPEDKNMLKFEPKNHLHLKSGKSSEPSTSMIWGSKAVNFPGCTVIYL